MQLLINVEKLLRYSERAAENRRERSGTEEARLLLRWKKQNKKKTNLIKRKLDQSKGPEFTSSFFIPFIHSMIQ